jgi:hypothetical protein
MARGVRERMVASAVDLSCSIRPQPSSERGDDGWRSFSSKADCGPPRRNGSPPSWWQPAKERSSWRAQEQSLEPFDLVAEQLLEQVRALARPVR